MIVAQGLGITGLVVVDRGGAGRAEVVGLREVLGLPMVPMMRAAGKPNGAGDRSKKEGKQEEGRRRKGMSLLKQLRW
jgi:hypothetical protein